MTVITATTQQHAIDLMPQVRDILGLPEDLDLPRLGAATFTARQGAPGWTVEAQLTHRGTSAERWEAAQGWAAMVGTRVELSDQHPTSLYESKVWRRASVRVSVAGVVVEVWAHLDGTFVPDGWCCVESYQAQDACAECKERVS